MCYTKSSPVLAFSSFLIISPTFSPVLPSLLTTPLQQCLQPHRLVLCSTREWFFLTLNLNQRPNWYHNCSCQGRGCTSQRDVSAGTQCSIQITAEPEHQDAASTPTSSSSPRKARSALAPARATATLKAVTAEKFQ